VYFEYNCWKFTGRLLDRVNTLIDTNEDVAQMFQFKRVMPWLHAPISSSEMLSDVTGPSEVYKPRPRKSSRVATLSVFYRCAFLHCLFVNFFNAR